VKIMIFILLYNAMNFSSAFFFGEFIERVKNSGGKIDKEGEIMIPLLFAGIMVSLFLSICIYNYCIFTLSRVSYLARSGLNYLIF